MLIDRLQLALRQRQSERLEFGRNALDLRAVGLLAAAAARLAGGFKRRFA